MSVKSYKGAVVLFGDPPPDNQVIMLYELSPLVRVSQDEGALQTLSKNMVTLLATQPTRTIELFRFVNVSLIVHVHVCVHFKPLFFRTFVLCFTCKAHFSFV